MSTQDRNTGSGIEDFRDQFVRAIGKQPARSKLMRRRLVAALVGVSVAGGSAAAVAQVVDIPTPGDPPPLKESTTIGFVNLKTNELILCPSGEPLVQTKDTEAKCDDGSVPEVYREQLAALERWWSTDSKFGRPFSSGPVFAIELDE